MGKRKPPQVRLKNYIEVLATSPVTPGGVASFDLPIGYTYHNLFLHHDANLTLDEMELIRLKLNGKVEREYLGGNDLNQDNIFDGLPTDAGTMLTFPFNRRSLDNRAMEELTSLRTGIGNPSENPNVISSASLEVKISDAADGATLKVWAEVSAASAPGLILKRNNHVINTPGAGEKQFYDHPYERGDLVSRIKYQHANITHFQLKLNKEMFWEKFSVEDMAILQSQGEAKRVPQDNILYFDPCFRSEGSQAIPTKKVSDFRVHLYTSDADAITEHVESIGPLRHVRS